MFDRVVICSLQLTHCLGKLRASSAANKGWSMVNYRQSLLFDHPYLSCNNHFDLWLFQEIFFSLFLEAAVRRCSSKQVSTGKFTAIFKGKHLFRCLFLIKFHFNLPKETLTQVFSWEYCEVLPNRFFCTTPTVVAVVSLIK